MDKRKRRENIMMIVASNLAQYMDNDMPSVAEGVFKCIIAEREPSPPLLAAYVDFIRPKKAQEILDVRERFMREPIFRARVQAIAGQIANMLDEITP
jgi:hypothetical protein